MFKKLSESLKAKFVRKDYLSRQLGIVQVMDIYEKETGIRPVSLKNKILTVKAASSVQANELRFTEQQIMDKVNQKEELVKRIIYRF